MTYQAGMYGMERLGLKSRDPHIFCDGCGLTLELGHGPAPVWLLENKAPKGWRSVRVDDQRSRHYCPRCKDAPGEAPTP